jgi:hypothetical protein
VRPWLVCWKIGSSGETKVDCVERNDQILGVEDLLEDIKDSRLGTDLPNEILVCDGIIEAHALVVDLGEVL